jgi:sugar-specific transcriptional regulator TrmB
MENQLIVVLTNLGLTDKEAKVYLSCTEIGTGVVSDIAHKAGINRVTAYDILEKLKTRGMVSYYTKKKIKYFSSIAPENLLEEFEKRTNDLRGSLPKFKTLTGEINHPRIRYFEGLEGIKAIYADTLTSKGEILNYSNSYEIRKQWPTYDQDYVAKRTEKQIYLRGICPKDKAGETVQAHDQEYFREMRLIPSNQFDFTNEINVYDDKVAIISFKEELIGMIIESIEIANSQRAIFNMCWQFANIVYPLNVKNKLMEPLKDPEVRGKLIAKEEKKSQTVEEENLSLF